MAKLDSVKIAELEPLLRKMDIPDKRKTVSNHDILSWLAKNLAERNSKHKLFPRAKELIDSMM